MATETTFLPPSGSVDVSGECTPAVGETFTLTYQAEGVATGPYPGTFSESGTVTATLATVLPVVGVGGGLAQGTVVTWAAEFEIDSLVGDVTGSKTLSLALSGYSECTVLSGGGFEYELMAAIADLSYEATIRPATGGTFTDEGTATGLVAEGACTGAVSGGISCAPSEGWVIEQFSEFFYLSTGVLPLDTSGKATGGGQIMAGSDPLEAVTFGFNVRKSEDGDRHHGVCNVVDLASGTHVKCRTVSDYQQIGNTATWEGTAEVNSVEEEYRITVQDNGEPNQGLDTFSITTDTYTAAGNVQRGNIQLHRQQPVTLP